MSEKTRLHPAAVFFSFIKTVKELAFAIILGFISFKGESLFYFILAASIVLILILAFSVISWYRYTYRVEDDELRIEYGIFVRKKRYISKNRIQSIDLTASVVHRIFKLTRVNIETAGSGTGAEASLKAVKLVEGETLRKELKTAKSNQVDKDEAINIPETARPTLKIPFKRLFIAGSTSGSIGVILALAAFGFSELEQFIPDNFYDDTLERVIELSVIFIIGLVIILLLVLWLLGIAGTMIKYGNFTITKNEQELFITRGLLEKKQLTIPLKRIQAVGIQESMIRQPLGYVTIFAEVAGGSLDKGEDFSSVLFPIMKADEVDDFMEKFLPDYVRKDKELTPLPRRARKFYLIRPLLPFLLAVTGLAIFLPQFAWVAAILLIASLYLGFLRHRDGGFNREGKQLTVRYRIMSRNTIILHHKRLQAFEKKQHKVHASQKLATIKLSIIGKMGAGTHFTLKELEESNVNRLGDWYSYRDS